MRRGATWRKLDKELIKLGRGFLAYGSIGYLDDKMAELSDQNRKRVSKRKLLAVVEMIRYQIESGYEFIKQSA